MSTKLMTGSVTACYINIIQFTQQIIVSHVNNIVGVLTFGLIFIISLAYFFSHFFPHSYSTFL